MGKNNIIKKKDNYDPWYGIKPPTETQKVEFTKYYTTLIKNNHESNKSNGQIIRKSN